MNKLVRNIIYSPSIKQYHLGHYLGAGGISLKKIRDSGGFDQVENLICFNEAVVNENYGMVKLNDEEEARELFFNNVAMVLAIEKNQKNTNITSEDSQKNSLSIIRQETIPNFYDTQWILSTLLSYQTMMDLNFKNKNELKYMSQYFKTLNKWAAVLLLKGDDISEPSIESNLRNLMSMGYEDIHKLKNLRETNEIFLKLFQPTKNIIENNNENNNENENENNKFTSSSYIHNLRNPEQMMKDYSWGQYNKNGNIYLKDDKDRIAKKIKKAVTDSFDGIVYDKQERLGISNLIDIYANLKNEPVEIVAESLKTTEKSVFKTMLIDLLVEELAPIQSAYTELRKDEEFLLERLKNNTKNQEEIVASQYNQLKQLVGMK